VTGEEFVRIAKLQAVTGAVDATVAALRNPPGRSPSPSDVELSGWYRASSPESKAKIKSVIDEAVQQAVFSFLALLDGVAALGSGYDKGRLLLFYAEGENRTLLNNPHEPELHNVFNRVTATPLLQSEARLSAHKVETARSLLRHSVPGDGLEIHHVPDRQVGIASLKEYDSDSAPAIALGKWEHRRISG
jgi:hypothetical protein